MSQREDLAHARAIERIGRVTAYIHDHLDGPLDLDRLAEVACLSRFHWHRIYRAMTGETAAETVRRLRLVRASGELANTTKAIDDVAARAGYSTQAAFTRAFAAAYGMPPGRYREEGTHTGLLRAAREANANAYPVEVRDIPASAALSLPHRGSYMQIGRAFDGLFAALGQQGLIARASGLYGIYLDDPDAVPETELRAWAATVVPEDTIGAPPLEACLIGGGRYAVLAHRGPYADMRAAYDWLFGTWLPQSGLEARDAPVLEAYLNSPKDTPPADLRSEICLPVEGD